MDFPAKIEKYIETFGLLRKNAKVVVALSGGADSVALLSVLLRLGYDCVAAHCNFHLRGEESNRDMHSVEALTARLKVDLYVKDFDVAARKKLSGESLEMACRSLRYEWFYELLDRDCAQAIAVGHHREDQAETFFINLMRGSGVAGLAGMRPRSEHVVRPLLEVSRAEIEEYLRQEQLPWIVDSSNSSDEFMRNRIRNRLIPAMEALIPGATEGVLRTMAILRENHEFLTAAVEKEMESFTASDGEIDLSALSANPSGPLLLFETLKKEGFSRTQTDDMLSCAARSGGTFTACGNHTRKVDHGMLRAPKASTFGYSQAEVTLADDILTPITIQISRHKIAEFRPDRNPAVAYFDMRALEGNPVWRLRRWRRGDRMVPFGMTVSKLLSDIFADAHLSSSGKEDIWLLTRNDEIVWAVGLRASSCFALTPNTRNYLRLEFIGSPDNRPI